MVGPEYCHSMMTGCPSYFSNKHRQEPTSRIFRYLRLNEDNIDLANLQSKPFQFWTNAIFCINMTWYALKALEQISVYFTNYQFSTIVFDRRLDFNSITWRIVTFVYKELPWIGLVQKASCRSASAFLPFRPIAHEVRIRLNLAIVVVMFS